METWSVYFWKDYWGWGPCEIYMFASKLNYLNYLSQLLKLSKYVAWKLHPCAFHINSFAFDYFQFIIYIFLLHQKGITKNRPRWGMVGYVLLWTTQAIFLNDRVYKKLRLNNFTQSSVSDKNYQEKKLFREKQAKTCYEFFGYSK